MKKIIIILLMSILLPLTTGCSDEEIDIEPPYMLSSNPLNISKFGFVARDGEWIYYIDGEHNGRIARTNGDVTETYENTYARSLNIYGDYIYYAPYGDDRPKGVYRIHKDYPDEAKEIIDTYVYSAFIVNDYIFYAFNNHDDGPESGVYRSNLNGEDEVQLAEGMTNGFQWADGWIYYAIPSEGKLLKMTPNGDDKSEMITEDGVAISTTNFLIANDWIYFESRDENFNFRFGDDYLRNIFRMKLDGTNLESLAEGNLEMYDENSKHIYFSSKSFKDGNSLFRMDADGSHKTELYHGNKDWSWVNISDSEVYLMDWNPDEQDKKTILYHFKCGDGHLEKFGE